MVPPVIKKTRRNLYLSNKGENEDIIVIGSELCIRLSHVAPVLTIEFSVKWDGKDLQIFFKENYKPITSGEKQQYISKNVLIIQAQKPSTLISDKKIIFEFYDKKGDSLKLTDLMLTSLYLSLDVDADRDGIVEENSPHKNSWKWGSNGHGAILLVNCDQDGLNIDGVGQINGPLELQDMSSMVLRSRGPSLLPDMYEFHFNVSNSAAHCINIFDLNTSLVKDRHLIGPYMPNATILYPGRNNEAKYAIEGLRYPDKDFDGLVHIHLVLSKDDIPIYEDIVQFRVAPWIMTPNSLDAQEVFVCQMDENKKIIEALKKVVETDAGMKLNIWKPSITEGDYWMQDEIQLGYTAAPHKVIHVVLESPRDKSLKSLAQSKLLGPDFGYITRYGEKKMNSLDSFGNLEVSPPVTVDDKIYPLGRILIGSGSAVVRDNPQSMMAVTSAFLKAQLVQPVVELFSDWLSAGLIDEFMTFVPSRLGKKFRLLLASPNICIEILKKLKDDGFGDTQIFEGKYKTFFGKLITATTTVSELLNTDVVKKSLKCQEYIDWNRYILKRQLGLTGKDIIEIPSLFEGHELGFIAYFPSMVNMLVVGKHLAIPKPFGPIVNGECAFEHYVRSVLDPLGLNCHFIDDWDSHHRNTNEIHCGTNTLRTPFKNVNWWDVQI